ncbi:formate dehydrogenase accessory protein FdhE [Steroidobacter cummioxidans]|uniref:formate dehydrogenase accessory protein FdhE n=1 Tax=Steroidobacter cummioxidans TaxID=1803913 RepID=UPI000E31B8AF|nr:formate dehydrogenase accessory protein FdhE [Steroidobacter cummioxidans]
MQRILDPGQIEAFAQRDLQRLRLPDRARVFSTRAARLRQQSEAGAIGHAIGEYLKLMAHLADAQQIALTNLESALPDAEQIAHARTFHMPPVSVVGWRRKEQWLRSLDLICESVAAVPDLPQQASAVCDLLRNLESDQLEAQADSLLAAQTSAVDAASAPFIMAALQVYWVSLASRLSLDAIQELDVPGVCPTCGTLPVASVVRADSRSQGLRYLHCALCATEWHMVRVKCSHCQTTQGISYQSIENGPRGIRAECCDTCHTYRKILYQEEDSAVEPVADDLASLALDLLLSDAGYHRASSNPLLWNPS